MKALNRLCMAAHAAEDRDWPAVLHHLRNERRRLVPSQLVDDIELAPRLSWLAVRGSAAVRTELCRIFRSEIFAPDHDSFAHLFSFFIWECGMERAIEANEASDWQTLGLRIELLCALAGASFEREVCLIDLLDRFVARIESAQSEIMERFPLVTYPVIPAGPILESIIDHEFPFRCIGQILASVDGAIAYPRLGEIFARRVLRIADWPVLTNCPRTLLAACWAESETIQISPAAREWVRSIVLLGPDPLSPDKQP